tara:strand:- start:151 stop:309 length:159 start_codon:yes stop_codon:yes gene_type:complete
MHVSQDQFELIDEALTDLSNKYNSTLINRQIGRILYTLDMRVDYNVTGDSNE